MTFLVGCSFTFETALLEAGVPVRHLEQGGNVPMYRTDRRVPARRPAVGPLVVSMRPVPAGLVPLAVQVTAQVPAVHGAPVHVGEPATLGIADLGQARLRRPGRARAGELPVFWACGVTPQAVIEQAALPFAITHAPGHMFVTDVPDADLRAGG